MTMLTLQSLLGLLILWLAAWLASENRNAVSFKLLLSGILLQYFLALALLKLDWFQSVFRGLNGVLLGIQQATQVGTHFVFGYLTGDALPFESTAGGSSFILAFQALPLILVISAFSAVLFHWRILPLVVQGFAWMLRKVMGVGGAVGLGAAANIFVGMVEAPLFVRPYLREMSRSELFTLMTCGMSTVAGTVMVLYASIISPVIPDAMGHILTASIISAPAAIVISLTMIPGLNPALSGNALPVSTSHSTMDAVTTGTRQGVELLIQISAMLIVLVALVHLANLALSLLPPIDGAPITLQGVLGQCLTPLAWLLGIPWSEANSAGSLLGTKIVLNEFLAYLELARLDPGALSTRSQLIMTYALCGFANFGSLGILIGGLGSMVPERRTEILELGMKSIFAGTLATCMTASIIGSMV